VAPVPVGPLPRIVIDPSPGVQTQLDLATARLIAHALVAATHAGTGRRTLRLHLVPGKEQSPPSAVAELGGRTYRLAPVGRNWRLVTKSAGALRP
jgi:hypothetical protein